MPQDPLSVWKSKYKDLKPDESGAVGPKNLTNFIDERVTQKLEFDPGQATLSPPPTFTWSKNIFKAALSALVATPDPASSKTVMATAWISATQASTMVIASGATLSPPVGSGIIGTAVAIVDPPSVTLAGAQLLKDLLKADSPPDQADSVLPVAFQKAFAALTFSITGADATAPTPIPIVLPLTKVK
jgi:hypothetical protein